MSFQLIRDALRQCPPLRGMPDIAHAGTDCHGRFLLLNYSYVYRPDGGLGGALGNQACIRMMKRGNIAAYPITDHGDYLVHQDKWMLENSINVSDEIRIMRGFEDPMLGWNMPWSARMLSLRGSTLWIEEISHRGVVFCGMGFPFYSILTARR